MHLALASLSAEAGHYAWACSASHQAVEKALIVLHIQKGSRAGWGYGLGGSCRQLPPAVVEQLVADATNLERACGSLMPFLHPNAVSIWTAL